MLKEVVSYEDYYGNEVEDTLYFNINASELVELEVSLDGGISGYAEKITKAEDKKELISFINNILEMSYGVISEDGKRFIKDDVLFKKFKETNAYSKIFMKLLTDDNYVFNFLTNIVPQSIIV